MVVFLAFKSYAAVTFLFAVSLMTVWQTLRLGHIPETPAQDLAKHVASILNFKDAIFDGQYLPRLQLTPAQIPDIPLFQFYGSLLGFLCLPFLMLGFAPITALTLGVLIIRCIGAIAIHRTGMLIGANSWSSSLAAAAYLLTPYIISNFYGRVAVPEATAHGVIAVLFYGVIRLYQRADAAAVVITGLSIVALSLAHPIYLLFGCLVAAIFSVLMLQGWFLVLVGCVFIGGMLLASFQWLPGFLYRSDFAANFTSHNPYHQANLTSYSGLFGVPRSLGEEIHSLEETSLFLTPGILTIPVLLMLIFRLKQPLVRATFGCLLLLLIASFSPLNFWKFVPEFLWALQFPYRLLSFVALFTSIGFCLIFKNLRASWAVCIMVLLVAQSATILLQQPYSTPLVIAQDEKTLRESFASEDYKTKSSLPLRMTTTDGWLLHYFNSIYDSELYETKYDKKIVDEQGILLSNNSFSTGILPLVERYIRVSGSIIQSIKNSGFNLWLAYEESPLRPLDKVHNVGEGGFSVIFNDPKDGRRLTIQCSPMITAVATEEGGKKCPDIFLSSIDSMPGNGFVVTQDSKESIILNIKGASIFSEGTVDLWLASPHAPEVPVSERVTVLPGSFTISLRMPAVKGVYMLVASRYIIPANESPGSDDFRRLSISINVINKVFKNRASLDIPFTEVERIKRGGYARIFVIKDAYLRAANTTVEMLNTIEIPMAFNRMITVYQNNAKLHTTQSDRGLISVRTRDLSSPLTARFQLPKMALFCTILGLFVLIILTWRANKIVLKENVSPLFRNIFR